MRANKASYEISALAGMYRRRGEFYSFRIPYQEVRSFEAVLPALEPNNPDIWLDQSFAYDIMRTEQHYATQTASLDLRLPIIETQHLTDLAVRQPARSVTFDHGILGDMSAHRIGGYPPLPRDLIGYVDGHLHKSPATTDGSSLEA